MDENVKYRIISMFIVIAMIISSVYGCGKSVGDVENITEENVESTAETEAVVDATEDIHAEENAKAEIERQKAEAEAKRAEEERIKAEVETKKAEEEARKAEEDRIRAEEETKKAEEERLKAEAEAKKEEEERLRVEAEAKKAEEERLKAEEEKEAENNLTPTQLTSINMLNYMTVLTQEINNSKGNQLFLEDARTSLYNDTNLKAVDTKTQAQIEQLVRTIDQYRMVDVKRDRLEYIYEQNQAQAFRRAIPNPMSLLSIVQSDSLLKAAASAVYMAVDSVNSYKTASNQAERQFIENGWELEDSEREVLQDSTTAQFNYMCNMVRDYDLPDEYVVRDTDVKTFVEWAEKDDSVLKTEWMKKNEDTYRKFGPYWLELVKEYYDSGEYENCISANNCYEEISARITRKDRDYAKSLPMVIIAYKNSKPKAEYVEAVRKYCDIIKDNTKDEDWALRYFAAESLLDLYGVTKDASDIESAYDAVYYNVLTLVDEQKQLNDIYLKPVEEKKADKGATKRIKKETKQYNQLLKAERKVAVPPVSEALYLNCELLFAIANEIGDETKKKTIDGVLHEDGAILFLTEPLDNRFRFSDNDEEINDKRDISFNGSEIIIPAVCISDRSQITVNVAGNDNDVIDDWEVSEVKRPKNSSCKDYSAVLKSKKGKKHKYKAGEKIKINVIPVVEYPDDTITFSYEVVPVKKAFVFNGISFERK